jgi:hypothetical protein
MNGLIVVAVILYGLVLSGLFIYGLNFFYHSYLTHKHRGPDPEPFPMDHHPKVTCNCRPRMATGSASNPGA